jgi:predicted enzyme related to lactoylglutathione lyase
MMRANVQGLGWYVRRSADPAKLAVFYRDVFGLPVLRSSPTVTMFWAGETSVFEINMGGSPQPAYTDRSQAPCAPIFRVHGFESTMARLKAAGVPFINDFTREYNRLAYFLDPDGHVTGIQERNRQSPRDADAEAWRRWDAGETRLPGADPMPPDLQHLGWIVVRVNNQGRQTAFYREVVGLDAAIVGTPGLMLDLGDTVLFEVGEGCPPQPIPSDRTEVSNTFILRVHDIDGIVADLKRQNVHFVNEIFEIPSGRLAYFVDPEGHLVGLQQRSPSSERIEDREANRRWEARQRA